MVLFQFLDPNSHSRLFSIEEEDAITLDSMELKLPRTLFIKSIPDSSKDADSVYYTNANIFLSFQREQDWIFVYVDEWQISSARIAMPEVIVVLSVNRKIGISTWSLVKNNEKRKRNRRRIKRRILTGCTVQTQIRVCVELLPRWNAHSVVTKVTAAKSASWLTGRNTSFTVSHAPPVNQPHPQTTGM